jgi:type I restriction enzyme, S subunit
LTEEWHKQQLNLSTAQNLLSQIKTERERYSQASVKKLKPITSLSEEELMKLPELPKRWVWVKISYLTLGVEYGTSAKSKESGMIPVLRMGNIQHGKFDWSDLVFTDDKEEIEKYLLRKNDVLFNRTNSPELVGKAAIYKGERSAIFAGYLIRVNQIDAIVNPEYLNYYLNCHFAKVHGNSVKTDGVNQSNINGEKLTNYPFPLCSLSEQHQIVQEIETRLSVCDKLEETISQSLRQAESLRQSILKKAFEGNLLTEVELQKVLKAPDWEPAEKLLERIKTEKSNIQPQTKFREKRAKI